MDELDLLLEELALNSAGSESVNVNRSNYPADGEAKTKPQNLQTSTGTGAVYAGLRNKAKDSKVYSDLSAPVAASLISSSPTKELDSILEDLMGLGQGDPVSSTTPPPPTQKLSTKRKTEDDQQQNKDNSSTAGSDAKASIQSKKSETIDDLLGGLSSDLEKTQGTGAVYAGLRKKAKDSKVYSDLSAPVAASLISSSPTKELDSILEDLMGLGQGDPVSSTTPPPPTQKLSTKRKTEDDQQQNKDNSSTAGSDAKASIQSKKSETIDDLLGGLSSDLEKIGVRTTAKGHCASCNKCIVGKMITALGEVWHPQHFVCVVCKMELSTTGFFERDGQPYCEKDYHKLFSPLCAYCKGPIVQNILTALDQTWHPEHFFCTHCGDMFGPEGFQEKDGKPYCCKDFYHLFAPKCSGCGKSVRENYLIAANGTWHSECFVCSDCFKPFTDGCFMELDGRPLCSQHFHSRQGTLCGSCGEPITGRCISALNHKFHPEHFVCAFCLRQLSQGIFKEQKGKPYCSACFEKLFVCDTREK